MPAWAEAIAAARSPRCTAPAIVSACDATALTGAAAASPADVRAVFSSFWSDVRACVTIDRKNDVDTLPLPHHSAPADSVAAHEAAAWRASVVTFSGDLEQPADAAASATMSEAQSTRIELDALQTARLNTTSARYQVSGLSGGPGRRYEGFRRDKNISAGELRKQTAADTTPPKGSGIDSRWTRFD